MSGGILFICLTGLFSGVYAGSTVVAAPVVSKIASADSIIAVSGDTGSKVSMEKDSSDEKQPLITDTTFDSKQRQTQKKPFTSWVPQRHKFADFVALIGERIAKKISGPLLRISAVKKHFKKIFFLVASLVLILLTVSFYRQHQEKGRFLTTTRLSIMDKEVQRACRYIEEHYGDPALDLHGICAALVTGGAFLEALFIKELGLTINDFIAQVRINRAKIALRKNPGVPVDSLAASVGFTNDKTFMERFTALTGADLQSYRDSLTDHKDAS